VLIFNKTKILFIWEASGLLRALRMWCRKSLSK